MKQNRSGLTYLQWLQAAFGEHCRVGEIPDGCEDAWKDCQDPKAWTSRKLNPWRRPDGA